MSVLFVRPDPAPPTAGARCDWILARRLRRGVQRGRDAVRGLPAADRVVLVVPQELLVARQVRLPPGARARTPSALAAAMEPFLLSSVDSNAIVALADVPGDGTLLRAVARGWLEAWTTALADSERRAARAIPEPALAMPAAGNWLVVWAPDTGGYLHLTGNTIVPLDAGAADTPPPALLEALRAAARDGTAPRGIDLQRPAGTPAWDTTGWRAALPVAFTDRGTWDWEAHALEARPERLPDLLQAGGLSHGIRGRLGPWRMPAQLAVAGLALHAGATVAHWAATTAEHRSLRAEAATLVAALLGGREPVLEPVLQARRELARARRAAGRYADGDALPLVAAVAPLLADLPDGALRSMRYGNHTLTLEADAAVRSRIDAARERLAAAGWRALLRDAGDAARPAVTLVVSEPE